MQRAGAQGVLALGFVPLLPLIELHIGRLQGHGGIGQSRIDVLSLAGALPVQQGQGHGIGPHKAGTVVVNWVGLGLGHAVAAEAPGHPGGGLGEPLVAGALGPGTQVPIGVQRGIDDVGLALPHLFVPQAQAFQSPRPVVLGHHVGILQQLPEDVAALLRLQIQQDAALASVDVVVPGHRGAAHGVVYLDYVGPVFGQGTSHGRPGQNDAQVQNLHPVQGGLHGVPGLGGAGGGAGF